METEQLKLLKREVKILEQINHPNIVDVIEVYDYDEAQLIVFEIMYGGEVIKSINNKKSFSIDLANINIMTKKKQQIILDPL